MSMRRMQARIALASLLASLLPGASWAADILGCSPAAQAVNACSDPDLAKTAEQLAAAFAAALARLSKDGSAQLCDQQRQWSDILHTACFDEPVPVDPAGTAACLLGLYRDRLSDLQQSIVARGPFLFRRVDLYTAARFPTRMDEYRSAAVHHIAYPQIEAPASASEVMWNASAVRHYEGSPCDESGGDARIDHDIGLVTARLISLSWSSWEYCRGAAHGFGQVVAEADLLRPSVRELLPADLFQDQSPWKERLATLVLARVRAEAQSGQYEPSAIDEQASIGAAQDFHRWALRPGGLTLNFNTYELGMGMRLRRRSSSNGRTFVTSWCPAPCLTENVNSWS